MKGEKIRMKDLAERFHEVGVVPVVVLEDVKDAVPLAQALVEGGLPCAEVTFRTAAAEESIRLMTENSGNAGWSRNCTYHRTGGCSCESRCKVYCKPWF